MRGHTNTILNLQEPDLALNVAMDKGQQDNFVVFSLKIIYSSQTYTLEVLPLRFLLEFK